MAFTYKIGYGTCEESAYWEYTHTQRFSRSELLDVVKEAVYAGLCAEHKHRKSNGWEADDIYEYIDFCTCMSHTACRQYLVARGFVPVEYAETIDLFGWATMQGWEEYACDDQKAMIAELGERLGIVKKEE